MKIMTRKKNEFNKRFKYIVKLIVVLFHVFFNFALKNLFFIEKKNKLDFEIITFFLNISKNKKFFI